MAMRSEPNTKADFERMAAELERIAKHIRDQPSFNSHFAERIELLARQMRDEAAQPNPPQPVPKEDPNA